jgi:GNAT superfamily N-acetyltransferase
MMPVEIKPLIPERWDDFERLFGPRGACAGCWCMYWKLSRKEFTAGQYENNRKAQKVIVSSGTIPGLIAYIDGIPAGWMAVEPRTQYPTLNNSRILKSPDNIPVWSITCFFVDKKYRNQGLTVALLKEAINHVKNNGGKVVEGYPTDPREGKRSAPLFVYTGITSAFKQAGFVEVVRRSETRLIMRYYIK